ncbi:MAG: sigma-54-dependent transcriptional regulator, partial [Pannonibacter phragmitetus]
MNTSTALASAAPKTGFDQALREASILVIDDEPGMRNFLDRTLRPRCRHLDLAASVEEAAGLLDAAHFDIVILDNIMGGQRGVDWLAEQRDTGFLPAAILITAYADLETAIQALQAGAADFVLKPFRSNQILNAVARCLDRMQLQRENTVLRHELKASSDLILLRDKLIGASPAIEDIRATIARVAPLPSSVLLTGQSGTGKEVAARMIHELSDRAAKPFVPVNCGALPADLADSLLFGHERGAFTGAGAAHRGFFEEAEDGTLFLDEIGDLPPALQVKLLRVLETREFRRLGASQSRRFEARVVCATNKDLEAMATSGAFREDLWFRINV